jgi:hypothetical protein
MNRRRSTLAILTANIARFALPAAIMLLLEALQAVVFSNVTMWRGVPEAVRNVSDLWTDEAIRLGWPTIWANQLKTIFWYLAFIFFVIGYILSAYLTVFLVRWLIF